MLCNQQTEGDKRNGVHWSAYLLVYVVYVESQMQKKGKDTVYCLDASIIYVLFSEFTRFRHAM